MMDAGRGSSEHDLIDPDLINRVTSLNVSGLKILNSESELEVKQITANVVVVIPSTDRHARFPRGCVYSCAQKSQQTR